MSLRTWIIALVISAVVMGLVALVIAYGFDDGREGDDAAYEIEAFASMSREVA